MLFFFILLSCFIFLSCTFHWADLSRLTFHYLLYPVWLCMWQIIKNLEPWTLKRLLKCLFKVPLTTILCYVVPWSSGKHISSYLMSGKCKSRLELYLGEFTVEQIDYIAISYCTAETEIVGRHGNWFNCCSYMIILDGLMGYVRNA